MNSTIDGSRIHFEQHIEPLMSRLQDESWRKLVMDVRGWYTYKAEEFYQDDDQKRNTYEAMGQLSGGEKAQLTYTILGSAIAYQFGLTKNGLDSSFRFIAIDEAFRAQDEDKARYLISLCKQLHLQLLVVTPVTTSTSWRTIFRMCIMWSARATVLCSIICLSVSLRQNVKGVWRYDNGSRNT